MKIGFVFSLLALSLSLNAWGKEPASGLKTDKQKFSYTAGYQIGQNLKRQNLDLDTKAFSQGTQDAISGKPAQLKPEEMQAAVQTQQKKDMEKQEALAKKNLDAGQAFLEANKKKEGVTATASGLQYKILAEGKGKQPKSEDTVVAHYRGPLLTGTARATPNTPTGPATFPVHGVIKGWQEVLPLMKEGAKWQVYIPSDLGYGPRGAGGAIGQNEVLIFDIELLSVKEAGAETEAGKDGKK